MLVFADVAFYVVHTLLIGFNMFGWIWKRTRYWHLITLAVTSFSWFVLGAFYGWGYCICTDWHFQIREQLGYAGTESTYVQLLARDALGISLSRFQSDVLAVAVFVLIVLCTAVVWTRDLIKRRHEVNVSPAVH